MTSFFSRRRRVTADQDADPSNDPDRKTGVDRGSIVHVAELQVH